MKKIILIGAFLLSLGTFVGAAYADHSWGNYHWARTLNPFTIKIGDNVTPNWDTYLGIASTDWNLSTVLDTTIVTGQSNPKTCKGVKGRVELCNSKYGNNGWLGIASVWATGDHITQATVKLNDTYFNTAKYNTPAWKQFDVCQEVGHAFGLDHQDEDFDNPNLDTCMDYTSNPASNQHPNIHDYTQLESIYAHLDGFSTLVAAATGNATQALAKDIDTENPSEWGKAVKKDHEGHDHVFERDLGKGQKIFTFVVWAE